MRNLTDIHRQLSAADHVYLEKEAEAIKIAEEEDAAGRIMARGFADELAKLANPRPESPVMGALRKAKPDAGSTDWSQLNEAYPQPAKAKAPAPTAQKAAPTPPPAAAARQPARQPLSQRLVGAVRNRQT